MPSRRLLPLCFLLALLAGFTSLGCAHLRLPGRVKPGLSVNARGQVIRNGAVYRGIGVNYFDAFLRTATRPGADTDTSDTSYRAGFRVLAEHKIPYARVLLGGFSSRDYRQYQRDKAAFFRRMDGVIRAAEENHVGIIADLFWCYWAVPFLVGEPIDAWGDPQSKTHAFMRQYVADVVERYKNSPAIWGWECGNEYNLSADLPNAAERLPRLRRRFDSAPPHDPRRDIFTSAMLVKVLGEFAQEVRRHDPDRLIFSGNAVPRDTAWHNTHEKNWKPDTPEQFKEILLRDNPAPLRTLTVHIYCATGQEGYPDLRAAAVEKIKATQAIGRATRQPVFVGEFGTASRIKGRPNPDEHAEITTLIHAIEASGVPLAALWNFDYRMPEPAFNITATNARGYMLDLLEAANARLQKN